MYRQSLVKIPPTKNTSYFSPLFHATHNNPGYHKNRAKVHSSFENKLELNTRHEGCTFSANKQHRETVTLHLPIYWEQLGYHL